MATGVDAARLLRAARGRARLSQAALARQSGVARSAVNGYETGRHSPRLAVLDVLLAACGLQARVELEPLLADLDARVDALAGPVPELDVVSWNRLTDSLNDALLERPSFFARFVSRRGPVTWAVDGSAALVCHGLAVAPEAVDIPEVVVVLDEALRFWLRAENLTGYDERDCPVQDWFDADFARIAGAFDAARHSLVGFVRLRVVEQLPAVVRLVAPWSADPVPVVTVDEVERSSASHAEVLRRWRERRAEAA